MDENDYTVDMIREMGASKKWFSFSFKTKKTVSILRELLGATPQANYFYTQKLHHKYKDREFRRKAQEMNEMIWCHSLHAKMQGIQQGKKFHHKQTMASLYYRVPLTAPLANTILSFYTITHYTNVILYVIITTYIDPTLFLYEPTISTNNKWSSFFSCDSIPLNDFTCFWLSFGLTPPVYTWPSMLPLHRTIGILIFIIFLEQKSAFFPSGHHKKMTCQTSRL